MAEWCRRQDGCRQMWSGLTRRFHGRHTYTVDDATGWWCAAKARFKNAPQRSSQRWSSVGPTSVTLALHLVNADWQNLGPGGVFVHLPVSLCGIVIMGLIWENEQRVLIKSFVIAVRRARVCSSSVDNRPIWPVICKVRKTAFQNIIHNYFRPNNFAKDWAMDPILKPIHKIC